MKLFSQILLFSGFKRQCKSLQATVDWVMQSQEQRKLSISSSMVTNFYTFKETHCNSLDALLWKCCKKVNIVNIVQSLPEKLWSLFLGTDFDSALTFPSGTLTTYPTIGKEEPFQNFQDTATFASRSKTRLKTSISPWAFSQMREELSFWAKQTSLKYFRKALEDTYCT